MPGRVWRTKSQRWLALRAPPTLTNTPARRPRSVRPTRTTSVTTAGCRTSYTQYSERSVPWVIRRIHRSSRYEIQRVPRRHQIGAHNPIAVDAGTGGRRQVLSRPNSSSGESALPARNHEVGVASRGDRSARRRCHLWTASCCGPAGHNQRQAAAPSPARRRRRRVTQNVVSQSHRTEIRRKPHWPDGPIRSVAPRAVHRPARRRRRSSATNDGTNKCEKIRGRIRVRRPGHIPASGGGRSVDVPQWEAGCRPSRGLRLRGSVVIAVSRVGSGRAAWCSAGSNRLGEAAGIVRTSQAGWCCEWCRSWATEFVEEWITGIRSWHGSTAKPEHHVAPDHGPTR